MTVDCTNNAPTFLLLTPAEELVFMTVDLD